MKKPLNETLSEKLSRWIADYNNHLINGRIISAKLLNLSIAELQRIGIKPCNH